MSIKKTWFSYILWLVATGFSVFFIYSGMTDLIDYYHWFCTGELWGYVGFSILFLVVALGVCFGLGFIWKKVSTNALPQWLDKGISIFSAVISFFVFVANRFWAFGQMALESEQAIYIYEKSRIGADATQTEAVMSFWEQVYTNALSVVFLFFGNKPEMMFYFQIFLQTLTLLLLMVIGWVLQRGICAWIPSILYAGMPIYAGAVSDVGFSNFWIFLTTLMIMFVCVLESLWKDKRITYAAVVIGGVIFAGLFFVSNQFLLGSEYVSRVGAPAQFYTELLIAFFLIFYCISFCFEETDNGSLYVAVAALYFLMIYALTPVKTNTVSVLSLLMNLYLGFVIAEGVLVFFAANTEMYPEMNFNTINDDAERIDEAIPNRLQDFVPTTVTEPVTESLSTDVMVPKVNETMGNSELGVTEDRVILNYAEPLEENMPTSKSNYFDWYDKEEERVYGGNSFYDVETKPAEMDSIEEFEAPRSDSAEELEAAETDFAEALEVPEIDSVEEVEIREADFVEKLEVPGTDSAEAVEVPEIDSVEEVEIRKADFVEKLEVPETDSVEEVEMQESDSIQTGQVQEADYSVTEEEEPVVIRVSDILRNSDKVDLQEEQNGETGFVIDKTAMIENVLPMPKKHVSRTLDYAFEPPKEMMHYDIEIENDDYDYE